MTLEYIGKERRALPVAEFLRERMGWWESKARGGLFHMPAWFRLVDPESQPGDRLIFGVHVTPDRSAAAIGVASQRPDGVLHLELVAHQPGVGWVVPWLLDRVERHGAAGVRAAGGMAAGALAPDLEAIAGFDTLNATEVRRACASIFDLVTGGGVAVRPHPALDAAVQAAARSTDRAEWIFDAPPEVDLSPLYAVTVAAWGARTDEGAGVSVFFFDDLDDPDQPDNPGDDPDNPVEPDDDEPYGLVPMPR
jgi:hypothetical protein